MAAFPRHGPHRRAAPGEEGTGIDIRGALEFSLPLGDQSGELAIAKERQRQQKARHSQAKDEARQRLAYERQRAALRTQVLEALAELQAAEIELAAVQQTLLRRRERRPLMVRRVASGVEAGETLWMLDDEITGLEKQAVLLGSQLRQQRLVVVLLMGEAWERALGLLKRQVAAPTYCICECLSVGGGNVLQYNWDVPLGAFIATSIGSLLPDLVITWVDDWRIEVGGLAERILLIGLIIAIAVLIPISKIGMPQLWAQYVGDLGRAIAILSFSVAERSPFCPKSSKYATF